MAQTITIPEQVIPAGNYVHEILAPARMNGAVITVTRPLAWPNGTVFTYRIYERELNGTMTLLTSATESGTGADVIGKGGVVNPPLTIQLTWPTDADRDLIRFEVDVVQAFRTGITVGFV